MTARERFENFRKHYMDTTPWRGHVDAKLDAASPFNLFLTRVEDSCNTHDEDLTITFPELLDSSFGDLEHSIHINFMVELNWLMAQYLVTGHKDPSMTILYDSIDMVIPQHLKIKAIQVKSIYPFGHHHTKMSIFFYKDKSLRIAIYTANLIESDWENRTQGVWISPKCPYLGDNVPVNYGESDTLFKYDILQYLNSYHLFEMREWLLRIQKVDMSQILVFLVASVPGEISNESYGYKKVQKLLSKYALEEHSSWDFVVQCSSIGSLGNQPESWLLGQFSKSFEHKDIQSNSLKFIYPSCKNVAQSYEGLEGAGCLPYRSSTHKNQLWLRQFVFQWKSDSRHRSKALPHIKTYAKISPDGSKLAWFLLTSANLSKAAWGNMYKNGKIKVLSYELGVLFLPCFMVGQAYFNIKKDGNASVNKKDFPLPYDVPLTPYHFEDSMYVCDDFGRS